MVQGENPLNTFVKIIILAIPDMPMAIIVKGLLEANPLASAYTVVTTSLA